MRVLFVTSPGIGHLFPTVPTAWALRAAGHEVLLATGGNQEAAARAGLQVVDTAPGVDFAEVFHGFFQDNPALAEQMRDAAERPDVAGRLFAHVSEQAVAGTVRVTRDWRPNLVVHTPLQGAGPLAAAVAAVPAVVHPIGFGTGEGMRRTLLAEMADSFRTQGVTAPEAAATLDVSPPSMRESGATAWDMRFLPYNGGAVLPEWLRERRRDRIAVTLGTVFGQFGVSFLRPVISAARELDAELVLALGGADLSELGELPANVRVVDWVPLRPLLAGSDAVIHHGGAGTTLTALDAGVPQLVLPHGADQYLNARQVQRRGAGAQVEAGELDAARLRALLGDTAMRTAAAEVAREMAGQPAPAELVPKLAALA